MARGWAARLVSLAFVLLSVIPCPADDPARFLTVTNWYATLSHTLNESGNLDYTDPSGDMVSAKWHYNRSITVSCQLRPDPLTIGNPTFRNFVWKTNSNSSVLIDELFDQTTTSSDGTVTHHTSSVNDTSVAPTNFSLYVDTTNQNYGLVVEGAVIPVTSQVTYDSTVIPGQTQVSWAPDGGATNPLPSTGMVLQGNKHYPMQQYYFSITPAAFDFTQGDPNFGGTSPLGPGLFSQDLILTWNLTPTVEQLEVVIESADYQKWLPKGDLRDQTKAGDALYLTAVLQTTNGSTPVSRATQFKFELLNVSAEPGVCLNNPSQQSASTKPDLKFESAKNQPPFVTTPLTVQDSGATAVTLAGEYTQADVGVSSFDFGAYGELKVTALVNGQEIVGYWQTDPQKKQQPLLLPRRQQGSKIADQWKEDNQATGLADDDDNENEPLGDGDAGDGLTLYEEYRGFSENLRHIRTDPHRKDFFVCDTIRSGVSQSGIGLFAVQSGLSVHSRFRREELHVSAGLNVDTWINFNHSQNVPHVVDQHAVLMMLNDKSEGVSSSAGQYGCTPAGTGPIIIDPDVNGGDAWVGVDLAGKGKVLSFFGAATTAHELAHTCAVWHHGDGDEKVTWNRVIVYENGKATTMAKEYGQPIIELYENDSPVQPVVTGANIWIGVDQGQHSGNQDCMMRYAVAWAYRAHANPDVRYLIDEVKGFTLCTSGAGTGINDDRSPQPRYGPALQNRGNCKGQICVNDLYNHGPGHTR